MYATAMIRNSCLILPLDFDMISFRYHNVNYKCFGSSYLVKFGNTEICDIRKNIINLRMYRRRYVNINAGSTIYEWIGLKKGMTVYESSDCN